MTEDGASQPLEGHLLKARPVNPAKPQKGLGIGGAKYFRRYRRHSELKTRKLADIHTRSNQTLNSLCSLLMTAHPHPQQDGMLQAQWNTERRSLIRSINNKELSEQLKYFHPQFP